VLYLHSSSGNALAAVSEQFEGVRGGSNSGGSAGVYGYNNESGIGVEGLTNGAPGETWGVYGHVVSPDGAGVFGRAVNTPSGGMGVYGEADSPSGVGVRGLAWDGDTPSGKFGTGVLGSSGSHASIRPKPLPNTGVYGIGVNGRGLVGQGDKAQLKLVPSAATSHPSSGQAGDLFVDTSHRLWFCRGGTSWHQLA